MEWDKVLEIGPFAYRIIKKFHEDIGKIITERIDAFDQSTLDDLILNTRKYLSRIFKDYESALAQQKQDKKIKVSLLKEGDVTSAIASLKQFGKYLPGFASRAEGVIKIIEVLL